MTKKEFLNAVDVNLDLLSIGVKIDRIKAILITADYPYLKEKLKLLETEQKELAEKFNSLFSE